MEEKLDEIILRLVNNLNDSKVVAELGLDKSKYSTKKIIDFFKKYIISEGENDAK